MTRQPWGLFMCLLLLSTIAACSERTPQSSDSPQAKRETQAKTIPEPEPGWKAIAGDGVFLSLPDTYEGGNPNTDIDELAKTLKAVDPGYEEKIQVLKQNPEAIALLAFDPKSAKSGSITNVNITKQKAADGMTIEQYLNSAKEQLATHYKVVEQKVVSLDRYQAGRIVVKATVGQTPIEQLFYAVQDGDTFWIVTYSTTAAEFNERLPNFEKSIRTLTFAS